jgi:hypothetical protein
MVVVIGNWAGHGGAVVDWKLERRCDDVRRPNDGASIWREMGAVLDWTGCRIRCPNAEDPTTANTDVVAGCKNSSIDQLDRRWGV